MANKDWMLNPTAISHARNCINIIQAELGVKLKLSHPQFIEMILEYVDLTESDALSEAYTALVGLAGGEIASIQEHSNNVAELPITKSTQSYTQTPAQPDAAAANPAEQEMIQYKGKQYPRYSDDGGEFKGLYRGQARYA